jgi:hypothetical protein
MVEVEMEQSFHFDLLDNLEDYVMSFYCYGVLRGTSVFLLLFSTRRCIHVLILVEI